jgi:hypothetical protein
MQKWFEGQTKSLRESSTVMYNTLETLERLNNINFTSTLDEVEFTKARGDNIIQAYETKLKKCKKMEDAVGVIQ